MVNGKFISNQKPQITFLRDCLTIDDEVAKTKNKKLDEIQLETDDNGFQYYKSLPHNYCECEDFKEFYDQKDADKPWGKGNVIPKMEKPYLIYSPYSDVYWWRKTHSNTNYLKLLKYKKDKNVFTRKEIKI